MAKDITYIAQTNFRGTDQKFGIRRTDRRQHMYVIGKTGTGKTQFLKNMALQDVENGEGLAVIDPHGEFVEEVLESIPQHRMKDVVYFNPADMDYPVSFNIMDVKDPRYKHLIASGLIGIFTKIWANVWSARMEYILANSILALLDTPGTTLLGIPRMLVDRDYRQKIINNLKDPVVKSFWINEYEEWESRYRNEAIAPVQNKVGQFLNVSFVRNIVGQAKNTIDIEDIMNSGKILLVNVSKGRIGEDNSAILGAMIITKIQLSAMERVRIPENERRDFYLYVDEFQNFATDSFRNILSEARKYRLNLIMAHQYIGQLVSENNTAVRDAVFGNVGTEISFRVGAEDAEFLEKEFTPEFLQDDFVRLANRDIYIKLMIGGITSRPFSAKTITIAPIPKDDKKRNEMIRVSREKYARTKQAVEEDINRWASNLEIPANKGVTSTQWQNPTKQAVSHIQADGTKLYDATCSNCGKKTKVIFEPTSGKPVYCKSCLKKMKADPLAGKQEKLQDQLSEQTNRSQNIIKEELHGQDSALADLGIEFGPSKDFKKPAKNQPQQKPQQVQNPPLAKPQVVATLKIETIDFKNTHHQKDGQHQNQPPKREINLAELRKALAESLEKEEKAKLKQEKPENLQPAQKQEITSPVIPANAGIQSEVQKSWIPNQVGNDVNDEKELKDKLAKLLEEPKSEQKEITPPVIPANAGIQSEVQKSWIPNQVGNDTIESKKEQIKMISTGENKPSEEIAEEKKPEPEESKSKYDPEEELRRMVEQERMADEAKKMEEIEYNKSFKKGEIKPGQTIKF